ncbi:hypothetical protein GYH30_055109 [Glycine max]|nr:hypothetical protein GYH30_055109 [Glycine max]
MLEIGVDNDRATIKIIGGKFGDIREIFVSKNRNRNGTRYGFARFKGVEDVYNLERKLDNIVYGGLKMYVNTPKFRRNRFQRTNLQAKRVEYVEQKEEEATRPRHVHQSVNQGTYAKVVAENNKGTGASRPAGNANRRYEGSWSSVYLDVTETGSNWAKEAWVGRLKNLAIFDRVENDLYWDFEDDISPKYVGDDMVLLIGLTDERVKQMMEEEERRATPFHSLEKWSPKIHTGYRLTWVTCWGIPLLAWDTKQISKIVVVIRDMVDVDDDVELVRRLDRARVLLKTPRRPFIQHTVNEIETEDSDGGTPSVKSTFRMDRDDGSKFTAGIGNKETTTASPLHRRNTTAFLPDVDGATFEETTASRSVSSRRETATVPDVDVAAVPKAEVAVFEPIEASSGTGSLENEILPIGQWAYSKLKEKSIARCIISPTATNMCRASGSRLMGNIATHLVDLCTV